MKDEVKIKTPVVDKVQIEIPAADDKKVAIIPPHSNLGDINKKFERIDQFLYAVVFVIILALISIIVSVIGIFLDQMHYNNVAYRYYAEKIQILDELKNEDKNLLYQINQDREIILKQQDQILKLLNSNLNKR